MLYGAPIKDNSETLYMISSLNKGRCVSFVSVVSVVHFHCENILKKFKTGNCVVKMYGLHFIPSYATNDIRTS